MILHITVNQLRGRPIILLMLMLFYPLYYDIIAKPNKSKKITQVFHLFFDFVGKSNCILEFKNSK